MLHTPFRLTASALFAFALTSPALAADPVRHAFPATGGETLIAD